MKWIKAAKGIRYREHSSRRYGNRPERYYAIYYKCEGKLFTEGLGWESENRIPGQTMLQRAESELAKIRENRRTGEGPITKKERLAKAKALRMAESKEAITLNDFFENHFVPFVKRKLEKKSLQTELGHYNNWFRDSIGTSPIRGISTLEWDRILKILDERNLKSRTKIYICGTLRRILQYAKSRGLDVEIPSIKQLGLSQPDNRRQRVITLEELQIILEKIKEKNKNAYFITAFAAMTGCRFSEAAKLKWDDVTEEVIIFRYTKNGTSRYIPISEPVRALLNEIDKTEKEYVFVNSKGEKYKDCPSTFRDVIAELGLNENKDAYNKICFHSLRHTASTVMSSCMDVRSLMDIMGWKSVSMAVRYMHGNAREKHAALENLGLLCTSLKNTHNDEEQN